MVAVLHVWAHAAAGVGRHGHEVVVIGAHCTMEEPTEAVVKAPLYEHHSAHYYILGVLLPISV